MVIRKSRCRVPGHGGEALRDAEAGVVDQDVARDRPRAAIAASTGGMGLEQRQVGRDGEGVDPVRGAQLRGQRLQPVGPPGDQGQVKAPRGIGPGEGRADAGRGAGDQGQACRAPASVGPTRRRASVMTRTLILDRSVPCGVQLVYDAPPRQVARG